MTKYRALTGLSLPANAEETARIIAARDRGEPLPMEERDMVRVEEGEVIEYVPDVSLLWLLEQNLIEEVDDD